MKFSVTKARMLFRNEKAIIFTPMLDLKLSKFFLEKRNQKETVPIFPPQKKLTTLQKELCL